MERTQVRKVRIFLPLILLLVLFGGTASAQDVEQMTLQGSFTIGRSEVNPCIVCVPGSVAGTLKMTADFSTGAVSGELSGQGTGQKTVAICDKSGKLTNNQGTAWGQMSFSGPIAGTLDPKSGSFSATAKAQGNMSSKWLSGCPGCTLFDGAFTWELTLTGVINADGSASGKIQARSSSCATGGSWTAKGTRIIRANSDPVIASLSYAPENPDSDDVVVITVKASDPDGDKLTFGWTSDGEKQSSSSNSVSWRNPPSGDHTVTVTVSDGRGGKATESITFHVLEHVGVTDRDKDGVPDDEDRCPDEWAALTRDGCPTLTVSLGCQPASPMPEQPVACSASVAGKRQGENPLYEWYLDGSPVTGAGLTWFWSKAEQGEHTVSIKVIGEEGREAGDEATLAVVAVPLLSVAIGMTPDPPLADRLLVFTADVQGIGYNEGISYEWLLDGQLQCSDKACTIEKAPPGAHTMKAIIRGGGADRIAIDTRNFTVPAPAPPPAPDAAAGFTIDGPDCGNDVTSDETLSCSARFRRTGKEAGMFNVTWLIDGAAAASETVLDASTFAINQVPPGKHTIEVRASDANSGKTQVSVAAVSIGAGQNAMWLPAVLPPGVPPILPTEQGAAAAGTLAAVGAWLWLEWLLSLRAAQQAAEQNAREQAAEAALQLDRDRWFAGETAHWQTELKNDRIEHGMRYDRETDSWKADPGYIERTLKGTGRDKWLQQQQAEYDKAAKKVGSLEKKLADLQRQYDAARIAWEITCKQALADTAIESLDTFLGIGLKMPPLPPGWNKAGVYGKEWVKNAIKSALESYFARKYDPSNQLGLDKGVDVSKVSVESLGLPDTSVTVGPHGERIPTPLPDGLLKEFGVDLLNRYGWTKDWRRGWDFTRMPPEPEFLQGADVRLMPGSRTTAPPYNWKKIPEDSVGVGDVVGFVQDMQDLYKIYAEKGAQAADFRKRMEEVGEAQRKIRNVLRDAKMAMADAAAGTGKPLPDSFLD